jgi:hypothetical protein
MFSAFYNESLRKLVIGFGSLFNEIHIIRRNSDGTEKERIRIPISYGPKEKFIRRITESSSISDSNKVQITLPRLGFEILNINYDPIRKTNKLGKTKEKDIDYSVKWNYREVPYNITFGLYSFTRTMDDNLQVIEQITPFFTPEFIVSMNVNDINKNIDIPIVLNAVNTSEDYEGEFDYRRSIISTFEFTAKTYVYGPEKTSSIILDASVELYNVEGDAWPSISDPYTYRVRATGDTGGNTGGSTAGRNEVVYE